MKKILILFRDERGAVAVIVAVAMVFLLGLTALVTDVGNIVFAKRKMVTAADAAALAGAQELVNNPTNAESRAIEYASKNGASPAKVSVSVSDDEKEISVLASQVVDYSFARALGFHSTLVTARAKAIIAPATALSGIVPFTVPMPASGSDFDYDEEVVLKVSHWNDGCIGQGNFGAIALGGVGGNLYEDNLKHGYDGTLSIGDIVPTEPGNMSGPTISGVQYRIDNGQNIIFIPLFDPVEYQQHGRAEIEIAGFACFEIIGVGGPGNENDVIGKFKEWFVPNNSSSVDPSENMDFGLYSLMLVE
ncbi:MAG: pilus assembly protein TadG-related protein [Thermacetogeniaceae bacterium]|jgi:hypothetical protein